MRRIVLDIYIDEKLNENDIIIYKDGKWCSIRKSVFLDQMAQEIEQLKVKDEELSKEIADFKSAVNTKLKEYHDLLQVITKEN